MNRQLRFTYSALSGVLLALAWAQWMNSLLLLLSFVPLLLVEENIYKKRESFKSVNFFLFSLISFGIWNSFSTWWIYNATSIGMFAAIILNTFLMSGIFWLFHLSKRTFGSKFGYFMLVFFWISFEYFHLRWELSWSWLNIGNGFAKNIYLVQWYEYTGILGGTLWVLVSNIIITKGILTIYRNSHIGKSTPFVIGLFLWISIPVTISLFRYVSYKEKINPYNIVVIQPNIDPYTEKFDGLTDVEQLEKMLSLAESQGHRDIDYFVAPETALPKSIREGTIRKNNNYLMIRDFLKNYDNTDFVIGMASHRIYSSGEKPTVTARQVSKNANLYYDSFNSAMQVDSSGRIQVYHKSMLVVGVEKMPFPKTLGFLEDFALELGGTSGSLGTQKDRTVFKKSNDTISIAPVICYESIFGDYLGGYIKNGANLIFVITNDAWWGDTPGYRQHLRFSQLRAVETRRSIARSANTGISCFIDQKGEIISPTTYNTEKALYGTINANDHLTFYVKNGDYLGRIFSFLAVLGLLVTISGLLRRLKSGIPEGQNTV